jgi:hypothetical protein
VVGNIKSALSGLGKNVYRGPINAKVSSNVPSEDPRLPRVYGSKNGVAPVEDSRRDFPDDFITLIPVPGAELTAPRDDAAGATVE